tara:strand:- start:363 stop:2720 length:2358 start_codon:yes stop_codon:yes gene_type:complete
MLKIGIVAVCINLARRPDRLENFKDQFDSKQFIIFPAIDGQKLDSYIGSTELSIFLEHADGMQLVLGELGCKLSHYSIINWISNDEIDNVLIMEDDILVNENMTVEMLPGTVLLNSLSWDIIYVGGQWTRNYGIGSSCHIKNHEIKEDCWGEYFLQEQNTNLYKRIQKNFDVWNSPYFRTGGAFIINKKSSLKIKQLIHQDIQKFISLPWDMWLLEFQSEGKLVAYDLLPHVFYQGGFDITQIPSLQENDIHRGLYEKLDLTGTVGLTSMLELSQFVYFPGLDVMDNDMGRVECAGLSQLLNRAMKEPTCIGVNTLGFQKNHVDELVKSPYYGEKDGIYLKKQQITVIICLSEENSAKFDIRDVVPIPEIYNTVIIHDDCSYDKKKTPCGIQIHISELSIGSLADIITTERVIVINNCESGNYILDHATVQHCIKHTGMFEFSSLTSYVYILDKTVFLSGINAEYTQQTGFHWTMNWLSSTNFGDELLKFSFNDIAYNKTKKPRRVMFTGNYWNSSEEITQEFGLMCKFRNRLFENMMLVTEKPDYWVIINQPNEEDLGKVQLEKSLYFCLEPNMEEFPWIMSIDRSRLHYFHDPRSSFNAGQWMLSTLNIELMIPRVTKQSKVASIISNKSFHKGHVLRIELLKHLDMHSTFLDVYSRENFFNLRSYIGPIRAFMQHEVFFKYKYYLMPENSCKDYYVTEKLWEPILCECVCFYWGCPNIGSLLNEKCFISLDITDVEGSRKIISDAIQNNEWEKRIGFIRDAKKFILNDCGILSKIYNNLTRS